MKVIFHERFYRSLYLRISQPLRGRMEAMVKSLKGDSSFVEPEPL